jgi:glycosyltransferase involved in cell wall biosynthesis
VPTFVIANSFGDMCVAFRGALAAELVSRGHRVILSTPRPEEVTEQSVVAAAKALGAEVVFAPFGRTSLDPRGELAAARHYRALFGDLRPAGVLATNPKPIFHALPAALSCGVPRRVAMVTGLGYAFTSRTLKARVLRVVATRLYRRSMRAATTVVFQNRDDRGEFDARGLLPPTLATGLVGGSGIDLARFPERPPPDGPPTFTLVARLLGDKGVREFAEAARRVRREVPEARFRLVGWIDSNPAAIRADELAAWVASGDIEHAGRVSDVRDELAAAQVFVLPSYREGLPKSTLEALATGRPIVTTDAPGCRETVAGATRGERISVGENGVLVRPRDAEALADACLLLARDAALRGSMGAASRRLAERAFDVRAVNATLIEALGA